MKAENVNPFLESVQEVFGTMLDCELEVGEVGLPEDRKGTPDIIGLIGISGSGKGIVALKMPVSTALAVVGRMIGEKLRTVDASVIDGVGEMVNIIAGAAKAKMPGQTLSLSLPTVVRGDICKLSNQFEASWLEIALTGPLGNFSLAVALSDSLVDAKEKNHAGTCSR